MQTYKDIYKEDGLTGGHVIMIGADPLSNSAAMEALQAYPGRQLLLSSYTSSAELAARIDYIQAVFHIGGGINPENALSHIEEGAGHVIIPSYVFNNGQMELQRLKELAHVVGKRRLVLDLSCRKKCKTLKFRHGLVVDCASNVEFGSALALTYTRLEVTKAATHVNVNWLFHLVVLLEESVNCHGKVKQIVGSTIQDLKEGSSTPVTNFESDKSAAEYANIYKEDGLTGGHVIMIGADPLSKSAAMEALHAYPGGLHVGGGINPDNALSYIEGGASHVIITSYVFNNGQMELQRLKELARVVGKQRLVLDLSCRKKEGKYAIVTDRWQKFTDVFLDEKIMDFLATYADEFLVHGVDVEGKKLGIDEELVTLLGSHSPIPVTYAGGVTVMSDLERIKAAGMERVDVTIGSALDIFGGNLAYKDVVGWHAQQQTLAV
ncbi:hypothetical protein RHGRI_022097 [Rhododendron griersonianum]|uniref:1-(5-phosphoribosyl)-5-[(5-phosphoribosylamino)methylideneamino] imidazole-4-carboxamide isomerase HISN3, chloroplastic n=1 Tax=Rhododendron griersonianum TaxID=479676 RepID=A0AAV6JMM5_9ERIC|nr:hypothetical protein RHGRI_022097 [Rhododendron griersonianum]